MLCLTGMSKARKGHSNPDYFKVQGSSVEDPTAISRSKRRLAADRARSQARAGGRTPLGDAPIEQHRVERGRPLPPFGRRRQEPSVTTATRSTSERTWTKKRLGSTKEQSWFSGRLLHGLAAQLEELGGRVDRLTGLVRAPVANVRVRMRRFVDELRRGNLFMQHP